MDDVLILEIAVGAIVGLLVLSALHRASAGTFLLRALMPLAALVAILFATGFAAALSPTRIGHTWDAFVGTLADIAKACVDVFL